MKATDLPFVRVSERRHYEHPDGTKTAHVWDLGFAPRDGEVVKASFGEVVIEIMVPASITEETLRDAVTVQPAQGADIAFALEAVRYLQKPGENVRAETANVLTVRWPGVQATERSFPNPARVPASERPRRASRLRCA